MMSMVLFDNYEDSLNTFKNPRMNIVLTNALNRINLDVLPKNDINYIEIVGPIFLFDLMMKKIDYMLEDNRVT